MEKSEGTQKESNATVYFSYNTCFLVEIVKAALNCFGVEGKNNESTSTSEQQGKICDTDAATTTTTTTTGTTETGTTPETSPNNHFTEDTAASQPSRPRITPGPPGQTNEEPV